MNSKWSKPLNSSGSRCRGISPALWGKSLITSCEFISKYIHILISVENCQSNHQPFLGSCREKPVFVVDVSAEVEVILSPAVKKSILQRVSAHSHICTLWKIKTKKITNKIYHGAFCLLHTSHSLLHCWTRSCKVLALGPGFWKRKSDVVTIMIASTINLELNPYTDIDL